MINSTQVIVGKTEGSDESFSDPQIGEYSCSTSSSFNEGTNSRRGLKRSIDPEEDEEFDEPDDYLEDDQFRDVEDEEDGRDLDNEASWNTVRGFRKQRGNNPSYVLRPRTGMRKTWVEGGNPSPRGARRGRGKSSIKSKYRRHTANARERDRMKEINVAFANLRGALPAFTCRRVTSMTKIKTLKLAASYIRALSDLLSETPSEESKALALQLFQDLPGDQTDFMNCITQSLSSTTGMSDQTTLVSVTSGKNSEISSSPTLEAALTSGSKRTYKNMFNNTADFARSSQVNISGSPIINSTPSSPLTPKGSSSQIMSSTIASTDTISSPMQCNIFSFSTSVTGNDSSHALTNFQPQINFSSNSSARNQISTPFLSSNLSSQLPNNPQLTRQFSSSSFPRQTNLTNSAVKLQRTQSIPAQPQSFSKTIPLCSPGKSLSATNLRISSDHAQRNYQTLDSNQESFDYPRPHCIPAMSEYMASTSYGIAASTDQHKIIPNNVSAKVHVHEQIPQMTDDSYMNVTADINIVSVGLSSEGVSNIIPQQSNVHLNQRASELHFSNQNNSLVSSNENYAPSPKIQLENIDAVESSPASMTMENFPPSSCTNSSNYVEKNTTAENSNENPWSSQSKTPGRFAAMLEGSESGVEDQDLGWDDIYWGLE